MFALYESVSLPYSSTPNHGICSCRLGPLPVKQHPCPWKIQRKAFHWIIIDYNRYSSITKLLHDLNWQSLQIHRKISRLQIFYKAAHNSMALSIPQHFLSASRPTRNYHQYHYIIPSAQTSFYQHFLFKNY